MSWKCWKATILDAINAAKPHFQWKWLIYWVVVGACRAWWTVGLQLLCCSTAKPRDRLSLLILYAAMTAPNRVDYCRQLNGRSKCPVVGCHAREHCGCRGQITHSLRDAGRWRHRLLRQWTPRNCWALLPSSYWQQLKFMIHMTTTALFQFGAKPVRWSL